MLVAGALIPLLWFGPDVLGRAARWAPRTPRAACRARAARSSRTIPALAVLGDTATICTLPAVAAVLAAVLGGPLARRIFAAAAAWVVIVAVMTVAGYAGNPRYLVAAAALGAALAGAGAVRTAQWRAVRRGGSARRVGGVAGGAGRSRVAAPPPATPPAAGRLPPARWCSSRSSSP